MKDIGLTLKDINDNLEKLKLSPKMEELFDYLKINNNIIRWYRLYNKVCVKISWFFIYIWWFYM